MSPGNTLRTILADAPLVNNPDKPEYMEVILETFEKIE